MRKSLGLHYRLEQVPKINGFAPVSFAPGAYGWFLARAFVDSDEKEFYKYVDQLYGTFIGDRFLVNGVNTFLVLIHQDQSADVFVNDLTVRCRFLAKSDVSKGQPISNRDIADIVELRFDSIEIRDDDSVVLLFRSKWKFGLFFDFTASLGTDSMDVERLYKDLGTHFKYLMFKDIYSIVGSKPDYQKLLSSGWFPFIQLLGGDYEKLAEIYEETTNREALLEKFLDEYSSSRIYSFVEFWWRKKAFAEKKDILVAGVESYIAGASAGYITCIKTLHSEIEGLLRLTYFQEHGTSPSFPALKKYVKEKAVDKFEASASLGFPNLMYEYFNEVIFKDFQLGSPQIDLSRHSTGHGVAESAMYTRERALQAILLLDQMHFFMD